MLPSKSYNYIIYLYNLVYSQINSDLNYYI